MHQGTWPFLLPHKYLSLTGKPFRKGVGEVKDPFAKFQQERDNKTVQSVFDAMLMIVKGKSEEEVRRATGVNKEAIQKIKELFWKEKEWNEINKIADENGGHYVVLSKPGEVDTSELSKEIKRIKESREDKREER